MTATLGPSAVEDDAEVAVLSAMLVDPDAATKARTLLDPSMFAGDRHRMIFAALASLGGQGIADPLTLADALAKRGELDAAGGKEYLAFLIDAVPTTAHLEAHAAMVREAHGRRLLTQTLADAGRLVASPDGDVARVARSVRASLDAIDRASGPLRSSFRLYTDVDLAEMPRPDPRVDGVAFADSLVAVIGAYASFKSFVLLDVLLSIAAGLDWHGRRVQQGACLYIVAEGASGIAQRVAAWKAVHHVRGSLPILFLPTAVKISDPGQVSQLLAAIDALDVGPIAAIAIDTLARCLTGSENDPEAMGAFIDGADRLRVHTGATVLIAHHSGWSADRSRGHSSLPAALATEILVERDDMTVTLKNTKMKDGPEFEAVRFQLVPAGESLVLKPLAPTSTELTRNEHAACQVLLASDGLTSGDWERESDLKPRSFQNARKRLVAIGYVKKTKRTYVATDALRAAFSAKCQASASVLPGSGAGLVPTHTPPSGGVLAPKPGAPAGEKFL